MVVFAVAILSKAGKLLLSRQYADMSRIRVEGLWAVFPKLLADSSSKQHTFVETPQVRYLYHPLETMYILLLTNKSSNIMEDLDTLRALSKVVPETCGNLTDEAVEEKAFQLIFAFDEMITFGGYKVHLSLHDIRTNLAMVSLAEDSFNDMNNARLEAAKKHGRERALEIAQNKRDNIGGGGGIGGGMGGGGGDVSGGEGGGGQPGMGSRGGMSPASFGGGGQYGAYDAPSSSGYSEPVQSTTRSVSSRRGMSLGKKGTKLNRMAAALAKEDNITLRQPASAAGTPAAPAPAPAASRSMGDVEVMIAETLKVKCARDGSCESFEVKGNLILTAHSAAGQTAQVKLRRGANKGFKVQPNPNVNRKGLQEGIITPKNAGRPFPLGKGVPVLRWRTQDGVCPLAINCWPESDGKGTNVNIEFTLERPTMTLHNVTIEIPLGTTAAPVVNEVHGTTTHRKDGVLVWCIDVIDSNNETGSLEFDVAQPDENAFFPLQVGFQSRDTFLDIDVEAAASGDSAIQANIEKNVTVAQFEVGAGDEGGF